MARGLQLVFLLLVCALYVEATSVTCAKKYSKKVTIKDGDSYTYMTQSGTNYESKSKCEITYKKDTSCSAMKFSCSAFAIDSPKVNCKGGDKMVVSTSEAKNKKYCQTTGPDVTTTGKNMKVTFTSNGNTEDTGAVCTVECVSDEETAPDPTEEPDSGENNSVDYCALGSDHTMCIYPGPSESCAAITEFRGFSDVGKQAILDKHNELRRRVAKGEETGGINAPQPGAADMRKLVWNDELAQIAQRLTDQCVMAHDDNRRLLDGTPVGQNLYRRGSSRLSDEASVNAALDKPAQKWYGEVSDPGFDSNGIASFVFDYGTGHYTQLVWAETEQIGCGMTYYLEDGWYKTLVNCNYARAGNWRGDAIYTSGPSCTACPSGYSCDDGLCVAP